MERNPLDTADTWVKKLEAVTGGHMGLLCFLPFAKIDSSGPSASIRPQMAHRMDSALRWHDTITDTMMLMKILSTQQQLRWFLLKVKRSYHDNTLDASA